MGFCFIAYQLGTHALKLAPQEILFVAFAGWDAAGAKLFGYDWLLSPIAGTHLDARNCSNEIEHV